MMLEPGLVDLPLQCASGAQCFVSAEILATKNMAVFFKPPCLICQLLISS
jgi:hypothetical protein